MPKSQEELKKEQEEAKAQLEAIFAPSRPKNLAQGVGTGVSNIVSGAVGGAGVAVLAPTAGLAMGLQNGGLLGGIVGVVGGAAVGLVGAAAMVVGGVVSGTGQILRGIAATPEAMTAPGKGKWWNEASHKWILTDLPKEMAALPPNDQDLLGKLEADLDADAKPTGANSGKVKDTFYYDILEVDPRSEPGTIKRQYYKLARKYHPDKVGADDTEAANKFKDVAEAYQVLSDPTLRAKYDTDGKEALSGDKTELSADANKPDPAILLAFLFGSDRFNDYIGRLSTSTAASLGDTAKLSMQEARTLQERRCTRLASKLAAKVQPWVAEDYDACKIMWKTEGESLSTANYGWELVQAIGMAYELAAVQFIGSMDSGIGLPSIGKWYHGKAAAAKKKRQRNKNQMEMLMGAMDTMKVQAEFQKKMEAAQNDGERMKMQKEMEEAQQNTMLKIIWTTTVVDITSTIHETCQMVFFDTSESKDVRMRRAHAVKSLGQIFQEVPEPPVPEGGKKDARSLFEEAALAATVETMKRKDEAAYEAGSK